MAKPEYDTRRVLDRSIGENLDRLITMDMRGDEISRVIYQAARKLTSEPLTIAGARFLLDKLKPNNLLSLCWDGPLKKTGPTTFEAELKNFSPKRDIKLLVLAPPKG